MRLAALYFLCWLSVAVIADADDSLRVEPLDISAQFVVLLISDGDGGAIWIGARLKGFMAIDPKTGRRGTEWKRRPN